LMTEKSVLTKLGPVTALRLRLPGWHVPVVPTAQGDDNSEAKNPGIAGVVEVAATPSAPNQSAGSPVVLMDPVTFGRTVKLTPGLIDIVGFNGFPVCA